MDKLASFLISFSRFLAFIGTGIFIQSICGPCKIKDFKKEIENRIGATMNSLLKTPAYRLEYSVLRLLLARRRYYLNGSMIANEGLPSDGAVSKSAESICTAEQLYRQKIVARQCLNMLVDIKTALSRQNKMLELMIDQLNAARIRDASK